MRYGRTTTSAPHVGINVTITVNLDRRAIEFCRNSATFGQDGCGGLVTSRLGSVSPPLEGAGLSEEFKEKRSFDDILWNTFIVIMVIFLGYALLLPRIRHVVERIQGKKSAVVAKAAPAKTAPETGPSAPAAQPPDTSATPPPSSTAETNSPLASAPPPSSAPSAAEAPHVIVNPPPETAHTTPQPAPKSPHATKPAPASKPPVQAAPFQGRYAVDAGSYTIRSNAERLASEMPQKYQPRTTITPVKVHDKLFYRVRIVVATKAEADTLSAQLLQKEKVHAVILSLR